MNATDPMEGRPGKKEKKKETAFMLYDQCFVIGCIIFCPFTVGLLYKTDFTATTGSS